MKGALGELLDEVHEAIHTWWAQRRARQTGDSLHDLIPDNEEIVFHPVSSQEGEDAAFHEEENAVCPVTRSKLDRLSSMYRCERCGLRYSPEGWQFLRETDKGACCSCRSIGTVHAVTKTR